MMGRLDTDPIPPHAVTCWADDHNIYVAMPMTSGGVPYITRYPRSEGGLSQALAVLMKRQAEAPRPSPAAPANYTRQPQVQLKPNAARERLHAETTESQRENARKVLLKLGLKP
jgi:hypothetical protein